MTTVTISTPGPWRSAADIARAARSTADAHRRLAIADETGRSLVTMLFSPQVVEHSSRAASYADADRDGRAPLLLHSGAPRPTLSFETLLARPDIDASVEGHINALELIAARDQRVRLIYGPQESRGLWRITELSWSSQTRNTRGEVTRATVRLGLTRAVDISTKRGPLSGGKKPPPAKARPGATGTKPPAPRIHVVKAGETLAAISNRYYRTPTKWRAIADRNKIRDPKKVPVGARLVIP